MLNNHNFVCAALPSVVQHCGMAMREYPEYLNDASINAFMLDNCNKYLSSIGVVIPKLPKSQAQIAKVLKRGRMTMDVVNKYVKILDGFDNCKYLDNTERIIDSGGFSIQQPEYFDRSELSMFTELYNKEFLKNHYDRFTYAFLLDMAPGSVNCPFTSFDDLEVLANESYKQASELPEAARKKLIYIHHFRTPKINDIYTKMLPLYGDKFCNFATGGLVSFARTGDVPPMIMYVIPLLKIVDHARKVGLKSFRFHVLGGSEWKEILGHKFLERHIKELFDIDVQITFDSSTLFKTLCMGRYTFNVNKETKRISKLSLRSNLKNSRSGVPKTNYITSKTNEEIFCDLVNEAVVPYGMKALDLSETSLYDGYETPELGVTNEDLAPTGRLSKIAYMYGMFQLLKVFRTVEDWSVEFVDETYEMFLHKEFQKDQVLLKKVEDIMVMFNGGESVGKNIQLKTLSIRNSLDLMTQMKEDPKKTLKICDELISRYMAKDECKKLLPINSKEMSICSDEMEKCDR